MEIDEEVVWTDDLDTEWLASGGWEVPEVLGDHDLGADANGGSQNMAILRVVGHRRLDGRDDRSWRHRLGKGGSHGFGHARGARGVGPAALDPHRRRSLRAVADAADQR